MSYLTQALGLTVQNFVSAATGIAVLFALIRGFIKVKSSGLGSFWVDLTRIVVHILLPLNLVISLLLVGGGVIQNLKSAETVSLVEPIAVSAEGEVLEDAVIDLDTETVTVDGEIVSNAQIVTEQFVPMGPAASQVAIKQTGTNGGGYMGVNSAHPLENPNAFTNLIEMISILLIPAALCFTFGSAVKNKKQGIRGRSLQDKNMHFVPFTAVTRMSGVDFDGNEIRKGAADAMQSYVTHAGGMYSPDCDRVVKSIASKGGTPLVVAKNHKILGVIYLKDIIKQGVKEKFSDLRKWASRPL